VRWRALLEALLSCCRGCVLRRAWRAWIGQDLNSKAARSIAAAHAKLNAAAISQGKLRAAILIAK